MTAKLNSLAPGRIEVVDALRGFALFLIVILHCAEQYNVLNMPEWMPETMQKFERSLLGAMYFLFGGKAYAIFSLLFGFSFYIQIRNQQERGVDFRWRFIWRMCLLFGFGILHSCFYPGDILMLYAVVGLVLVPFARAGNKTILIAAIILMLQPLEWYRIIRASFDPDFMVAAGSYMPYYFNVKAGITGGSFLEMLKVNIWDGVLYGNLWAVENGRPFQTAALFLFGMLAGRTRVFEQSTQSKKFWKKALIIATACWIPLYALRVGLPHLLDPGTILTSSNILTLSISNFAFAVIIASGFVLLWFHAGRMKRAEGIFTEFGRMTLTNYIVQSILGTAIFYGWGLGMYQWIGASGAILVGIIIFVILRWFSIRWLSGHKQGPLETVWKKGTWLFSAKKPN